ncbi:replication initiator protein A [Streptococcus alactolyticus]|uniref:replication initiator protein A n=1 Tax=Streptococcus alactolyticus TaxID=29389 RepID=UPI003F99AC57
MGRYDYFQEKESDQFTFFRIPKMLFSEEEFSSLSSEAKILYGLMLDRVSLSRCNDWKDSQGNVYIIFTIEDMVKTLKWSKNKICSLLDELDDKNGIGLIERKRRGLGKPNVIYVKNFASTCHDIRGDPVFPNREIKNSDSQEVMNSSEGKSRIPIEEIQEFPQKEGNKTNNNKNEKNNTEKSKIADRLEKKIYGSYQNVRLSDLELAELMKRFPIDWKQRIERLSQYMASSGKSYKNHYATMCMWADRETKDVKQKNYELPVGKGF